MKSRIKLFILLLFTVITVLCFTACNAASNDGGGNTESAETTTGNENRNPAAPEQQSPAPQPDPDLGHTSEEADTEQNKEADTEQNKEADTEQNKEADTEQNEKEIRKVNVYCGNNKLEIELADNPSAKAFAEKLKEGDVTVTMNDYPETGSGFEKVGELGFSLVQSNTQITTEPGDVILYLGSNITIYYDTNSWNFTLLGKINGATRDSILNGFFGGKGEVTVTFSLK